MYSLLMYFSVCQLFKFCVCWYCLIIKLNVPQVLSNRLKFFTIVITFDPSDHSYAVCVCVCLFLYLCFTFYFSLLSMTTMLFDLTAALNKPLLKQNNVPISILMTIAFSLVQRSGFGSHHNYCDKISCFQLINRVRFDLSS